MSAYSGSQVNLNPGEDDEHNCRGFRLSLTKSLFSHFLSIILLGLPYLVGYWKPTWRVRWFKSSSPLFSCDTVLVVDPVSGDAEVHEVKVHNVSEDIFPAKYIHRSRHDGAPLNNDTASDTTRLWTPTKTTFRFFHHKNAKYVWNSELGTFARLSSFDRGHKLTEFSTDSAERLSDDRQLALRLLYGPNTIDVEVKSYVKLLFQEVLNPFYIFQIASITLWSLDQYYYYASCIFLISAVSVALSLIETRRQSKNLHDMVAASNDLMVNVYRGDDHFDEVASASLIPGDFILVPTGNRLMACDAVLVTGSCIVNESMLTGESIPVTKSAVPYDDESDETYDVDKHKRHTLFAGTSVIQTRCYGESPVLAVVVRTGFSTAKGELIRSILFPKPMGFKFYQDAIKFIAVLFCVAALGMGYCIYVYVARSAPIQQTILRCLDIITIVVPPALPAAMTVGTYYAQSRLKKAGIFCISPQRINICGKLKLICFDKTGTLTEDGLDMWGVIGVSRDETDGSSSNNNEFVEPETDVASLSDHDPLKTCLAACHSLTVIDEQLIGDPLDIKMFESTGWVFEEADNKFDTLIASVVRPDRKSDEGDGLDYIVRGEQTPIVPEIGIIRQFTFSSSVARMSVITRSLGDKQFHVYVKGAPEKIIDLCRQDSIPKNFHNLLSTYTLRGFRVIGLAKRVLPPELHWIKVHKMKRDEVETDLSFLGFLIMQNSLKPETTPVIKELKKADIRCVMVTGDNLLTAISVARDCQIIDRTDRVIVVEASAGDENKGEQPTIQFTPTEDSLESNASSLISSGVESDAELGRLLPQSYHFAMCGKTWGVVRTHFYHLLPKLIARGTVFARMAPEQKAQLVEEYQAIDYIVSMVGDGANDCGALKAAHVGISLSEAEASVAAPFTSRIPNISCVPIVIREGRCALVTSFGVFKYMALYSMVQFVSVLILYTLNTNLGDTQFLYIDLAITTTVAVLMGWTEAHTELVPRRPQGSLTSGPNLFSIFSQILITTSVQAGGYMYLKAMPWYKKLEPADDEETEVILCWETTVIFILSSFQYLILATVFSKGRPFRKPFYTNLPFLIAVIGLTIFNIVLAIYPGQDLANFFELMFDPEKESTWFYFRLVLLGLAIANLFACYLVELVIAESRQLKMFCHFLARKKGPKNRFKVIKRDMDNDNWPNFVLRSRNSSNYLLGNSLGIS